MHRVSGMRMVAASRQMSEETFQAELKAISEWSNK